MKPQYISAELRLKGCPAARIAREVDPPVSRSLVTKVINGNSTSRRVAKEISRRLGIPLETLFPGRYGQQRVRKRARG